MVLQLGALRDALAEAGASPDSARKATEEAAGYENRVAKDLKPPQVDGRYQHRLDPGGPRQDVLQLTR